MTSSAALSLSATVSQYFTGGMMPELANPVQQSQMIIEIRPFRGDWQCYEGTDVQPYWTGDHAKEGAIDYAKAGAKLGYGEIRVLKHAELVESSEFRGLTEARGGWYLSLSKNSRLADGSAHRDGCGIG